MTTHGGYLFGSPLGYTTNLDPTVVMKSAGFFEPSKSMVPDFSRIPGDWLTQWSPKSPGPILAMSLGLDKLNFPSIDTRSPSDQAPLLLEVPAGGWIAFEYTIDTKEFRKDETDGGEFVVDPCLQGVADSEIGGTVFNCLVPGSVVDPNPEGFAPHVGLRPEDIELPAAANNTLRGIDLHIALFDQRLTNANSFFSGALANVLSSGVKIYFTLNPDFIASAQFMQWVGSWMLGTQLPEATIFESSWQPSAGRWTQPVAYRSLPPGKEGPITALCIDTSSGSQGQADPAKARILVSRRHASLDDKVEVALAGPGPVMGVLRNVDVLVASPGDQPPSGPPRRRRVSRLLGAGRGLGDMCTADPYVLHSKTPDYSALLIDFAVATRKAHASLNTGKELRVSGFLHGKRRPAYGGKSSMQGPVFTLPHLRTMMNGPRLRIGNKVTVHFYKGIGNPPAWTAIQKHRLRWMGKPLVADCVFPAVVDSSTQMRLAAVWRCGWRASPACILRIQ